MASLCRDCGWRGTHAVRRCPGCRSPRVLTHDELDTLSIAHIDCDAFYASVEKRDRPEIADQPVVIGGGRRGVVSTACYIARIAGVRSAMPMFKALKLCPDAVVIRPDMARYVAVSREIKAMMLSLTPLVEPLSLDEAFLDLTGTEQLHGTSPAGAMAGLVRRIEAELGLSASVGLSDCKFLAKIASDLEKPRGFSVIGRAEALDFLTDKPVSMIWGVGRSMNEKLERDGLRTIGALRGVERSELMARYGSMGTRLHMLAHAQDAREVSARSETKSISSETTFSDDIADPDLLRAHLWRLSEKVSAAAKAKELAGRTITLKMKTSAFRIVTRSVSLDAPTQLADVVDRRAGRLLETVSDGTAYRLIGVGLSSLSAATQADPGTAVDLFDPAAPKRAAAERAVDELRAKFGRNTVRKGRGFSQSDE